MSEATPGRFLLYLDILGFSEMTRKDGRKVARTYAILDKLNAHKDAAFKTIVFSDTILIYNPHEATSDEERKDYVWYMTEAAEHLYSMLVGQDIWFRAILIAGEFQHYNLNHVECFYGNALIDAHLSEKRLPMTGMVVHDSCLPYFRFFRHERFTNEHSFVYLSRPLESLHQYSGDQYPVDDSIVADMSPNLPEGVRYLADLHNLMRTNPEPTVRVKALTTWDFYARRYPGLIAALTANEFKLEALAPAGTWADESRALNASIKSLKRAGAGSEMSIGLNRSPRERGSSSLRRKR
ncbi:hypothetical protein ACVWZA_001418 [Sphingomonas sp. UYAg733]